VILSNELDHVNNHVVWRTKCGRPKQIAAKSVSGDVQRLALISHAKHVRNQFAVARRPDKLDYGTAGRTASRPVPASRLADSQPNASHTGLSSYFATVVTTHGLDRSF